MKSNRKQPAEPTISRCVDGQNPISRMESLRRMLLDWRRTMLKEIDELLGDRLMSENRDLVESVPDESDQALMNMERERDLSLMEMRNRQREMIDSALVRLEEGRYGRCEDCEGDISEKRLKVVPFARRCLRCQEKQELLEKIEREENQVY